MAHGQIVTLLHRQERDADWAVMRKFDERDLVRHFVAAGFAEVVLEYHYRASNHRESEILSAADFLARTPSYAEAAREVLGMDATGYLTRLSDASICHRQNGSSAEA